MTERSIEVRETLPMWEHLARDHDEPTARFVKDDDFVATRHEALHASGSYRHTHPTKGGKRG